MKFFLIITLFFSSLLIAQSRGTAYPDKENRVQECQQCGKLTNKLHIHKGILFCPVCVIKNRFKVANKTGTSYKTYPFSGKKTYRCKKCQLSTQEGYYYKKEREIYCQSCAVATSQEKLGNAKKKKYKKNTSLAHNKNSEKVAYLKKLSQVQKCRVCGMFSNKLFDGDGFLYCHNCARKQGFRTTVKVGLGKVVISQKKTKNHEKVYIKKFKHGKRCQKCKTHARNLYQGKTKLYCYRCVVTNKFEIVAAPKSKKPKKKPKLVKSSSKRRKNQSRRSHNRPTAAKYENHEEKKETKTPPSKEDSLPKKKQNPIIGIIVLLALFPLTYFICRMGGLFFREEEEGEDMGDVDFS